MPQRKQTMQSALVEMAEQIKIGTLAPNIGKYSPHQKQYQFHSSKKQAKLYMGGNRSGKTTGGVCEAIWRATCTHPYRPDLNSIGPNRGRVVAVDFVNGVEKIIFPQYKQWVKPSMLRGGSWDKAYDKEQRVLNFANGSTIEFMSYDQILEKFAGTSRHWIHFDEEPPRPIWVECLARLVDTEGDYWITMTPVLGMTWIYEDLYEPWETAKDDHPDVEVILINTLENPYLTEKGVKTLMNSVNEEDVETRIGGQFVRQGGLIYKNFDPTLGYAQVLPDPIMEPAKYFPASKWLWILCMDHGLNNPSAFIWLAVNDQGFVVAFDEWYKNDWSVDMHARKVKEKIAAHGRWPDILVGDPSIQNRNAVTMTSIQQEYQRYGLSFTLGNNDVAAGIIRLKKYFNRHKLVTSSHYERHPLYGGTPLANSANQMRIYNPESEYYRLYVSPICAKLIWELKQYRWKTYTDKKKQFENNPYDEPHKKNDHACDALRYGIMTQPDLFANNNEAVNPDDVDAFMVKLQQKIVKDRASDYDDPNGLMHGAGGWVPGMPIPTGDTSWDFDEHMGVNF